MLVYQRVLLSSTAPIDLRKARRHEAPNPPMCGHRNAITMELCHLQQGLHTGMVQVAINETYGGFHQWGGTPSHHPFPDGILPYKPSNLGASPFVEKPISQNFRTSQNMCGVFPCWDSICPMAQWMWAKRSL